MTRPSVLLIASFAESVPTFRGALIRAMRDAGMEVDVAVPLIENSPGLQDGLAAHGVTAHGIPLRRTGTNPLADLTLVLALYRLIRKLRPTVTLPYTIKPVIYGTIAAWLAGVPRRYALITGLGYAFTDKRRGLLTRIIGMLYRFALGKAHKVFFQNPDDESLFRSRGLLPRSVPSVVVDGSGVDVATFAVVALLSGQPRFLMIGRLLGDKGVREYAEAARRIKARHPAVQFRLAGWIDTNPDAINQAELDDWVADGTLEFLGKLDDVRPAIAASTVYVLP
ncbi:MAG: glycosyltransferase, partial [Proteobacteria bacterium]|nr:glycosyltransferase [Pseudomonadota bacterium]